MKTRVVVADENAALPDLLPRSRAQCGLASKTIANRLGIAPKTIEHHRARLMQKLGVHDVATLTRTALRLGLVE